MLSLLEHCHGEKTHFSRNEKRTFSLSQTNNVELARTLPWRENTLFEEREKNKSINLFFAPYSEVVLTLNISTNWEEFMSLYCKTKINTPTMHEVPNYEVRLSLKLCPICLGKTWLCFRKRPGWSYSIRSLQVESLAANGRLFLRLHGVVSVGRGQHALQPFALAVASTRILCAVAHSRVYAAYSFCLTFSADFNIMSALFVHQSFTLPQKIDSRGGLFWCQKGAVVHADKMNFYLKRPPLTLVLGRFAAKCSVFWC